MMNVPPYSITVTLWISSAIPLQAYFEIVVLSSMYSCGKNKAPLNHLTCPLSFKSNGESQAIIKISNSQIL